MSPRSTAAVREVVVIGGGVSGLTCAATLLDAGLRVRLWATHVGTETTAAVAAALWFPYRVHPADRVRVWATASHRRFVELAQLGQDHGIVVRCALEVFPGKPEAPDWRAELTGFREAAPHELPSGYASGYVYDTPVIETPRYLPWLVDRVTAAGAEIERRRATSVDEALAVADAVVNATGLGARDLVGDARMTPVRGQDVTAVGASTDRVLVDEHGPRGVRYLVPRLGDVVCGGSVEEGSESLTIDAATTRHIVEACTEVEPRIADASDLEAKTGIRPCRDEVRLEREDLPNGVVVHDYGHGGAGVTLSWGCALEVLSLLQHRDEPR